MLCHSVFERLTLDKSRSEPQILCWYKMRGSRTDPEMMTCESWLCKNLFPALHLIFLDLQPALPSPFRLIFLFSLCNFYTSSFLSGLSSPLPPVCFLLSAPHPSPVYLPMLKGLLRVTNPETCKDRPCPGSLSCFLRASQERSRGGSELCISKDLTAPVPGARGSRTHSKTWISSPWAHARSQSDSRRMCPK